MLKNYKETTLIPAFDDETIDAETYFQSLFKDKELIFKLMHTFGGNRSSYLMKLRSIASLLEGDLMFPENGSIGLAERIS